MKVQNITSVYYIIQCINSVLGFSSLFRITGIRPVVLKESRNSIWKSSLKRYAAPQQEVKDTGIADDPWSFTAFFDKDDQNVTIENIQSNETVITNGQKYHLSSPREWLEATEQIDGTFGVYTVMRCDISTMDFDLKIDENNNNTTTSSNNVKVWGQDFHLERLSSSYKMLYNGATDAPTLESAVAVAIKKSLLIYSAMISHVTNNLLQESLSFSTIRNDGDDIYIVMKTLLWQPRNGNVQDIQVRGHAFCTNKPSSPSKYDPTPTTATVALVSENPPPFPLPTRYDKIPAAKVSSWCRIRRPLEQRFKLEQYDVGEVILTRLWENDKVELLEGLTSNVFVVYNDGTLRTPMGSVLHGYARQLVIEAAKRMGWIVVTDEPICLEDAQKGCWKEVFLTSSIRLVIPIGKVLVPIKNNDDNNNLTTIWSSYKDNNNKWSELYHNIINHIHS